MVGKFAKCVDLAAAVFLMFLFPAVSIHVKMRDRLFDACAARVKEYGEMMQKQGYLSRDVAKYLFGEAALDIKFGGSNSSDVKISGMNLSDMVEIAIWEEWDGEKTLLTFAAVEENSCDYLGAAVYPFSCGQGILFQIRMPADGFEKAYYYFCGEAPARECSFYFTVRDGLAERLWLYGEAFLPP